jgi:hypothetical protein
MHVLHVLIVREAVDSGHELLELLLADATERFRYGIGGPDEFVARRLPVIDVYIGYGASKRVVP